MSPTWRYRLPKAIGRGKRVPITPDSDPESIRDAHLVLLENFGRSIGFGFYAQPLLKPSSAERITVLGRFDRYAPQREFGLQLGMEQLDNGRLGRVAWVIDLYLPRKCRRKGAGTRLIESLMKLWEEAGAAAARATTTEVGFAAFTSWGFTRVQGELEDQLQPVHLLLPRDIAFG
jgi:GNAT superfamily N-acetyltransferase